MSLGFNSRHCHYKFTNMAIIHIVHKIYLIPASFFLDWPSGSRELRLIKRDVLRGQHAAHYKTYDAISIKQQSTSVKQGVHYQILRKYTWS